MTALETTRLILRPPVLDDIDSITENANDLDVVKGTLSLPFPYERQHAESFLQYTTDAWEKGEEASFAMVRKADRRFIGMCGIHPDTVHLHAETGYWLGKAYWNQGYATEAVRAVIDYGFRTYDLNRVFARHFHSNPASGRVMVKVGMVYEGLMRQHYKRFNEWVDVAIYSILRSEWEAQGKNRT